MDTNTNSMISKSELLNELYNNVKKDSKDPVGIDTLKQLIEDYAKFLGVNLKPEWGQILDKIFAEMDVDSNGKITFQELLNAFNKNGMAVHNIKEFIVKALAA